MGGNAVSDPVSERILSRPPEEALKALDSSPTTKARADAEKLARLLDARRFDLTRPPAKPIPRFLLMGKVIATPGNMLALQAAVKAGKSAFVGALLASTMKPTGDCLGIESANPQGLAVVHFDTEQSPYDHYHTITRALRRTGRSEPPSWLRSYYLADVPTRERRQIITFETERAAAIHGGVHSVLIDGIGDVCINVLDPEESVELVDELHQLAIRFSCTFVPVLHENPGSENGKTRGHLGSQLERKAETNLRLQKETSGITTAFSEKSRGAHIPKGSGVQFAFDEALGMHVTVEVTPATGRPKSIDDDAVLKVLGTQSLTFEEWAAQSEEHAGVSRTSFKRVRLRLLEAKKVFLSAITGKYEQTASTISSECKGAGAETKERSV